MAVWPSTLCLGKDLAAVASVNNPLFKRVVKVRLPTSWQLVEQSVVDWPKTSCQSIHKWSQYNCGLDHIPLADVGSWAESSLLLLGGDWLIASCRC